MNRIDETTLISSGGCTADIRRQIPGTRGD